MEIVIESTGIFTDGDEGARPPRRRRPKVIISAPAKNEDVTLVLGVNEDRYDPAQAPHRQQRLVHDQRPGAAREGGLGPFGIEQGLMTTVHSYTNDQNVLDVVPKDLRRARSAGQNIIPTTTGAAKALALVIPELKGKFDGFALRVPTPTVSVIDFVAVTQPAGHRGESTPRSKAAADGPMKGLLGYTEEPLVSMDFKGDEHSTIVDADSTMVVGENMSRSSPGTTTSGATPAASPTWPSTWPIGSERGAR